jgi:hypothetical protein
MSWTISRYINYYWDLINIIKADEEIIAIFIVFLCLLQTSQESNRKCSQLLLLLCAYLQLQMENLTKNVWHWLVYFFIDLFFSDSYRTTSIDDCSNIHHGTCVHVIYQNNNVDTDSQQSRQCICKEEYTKNDYLGNLLQFISIIIRLIFAVIAIRCIYPQPTIVDLFENNQNMICPPSHYCLPKYFHCIVGKCRSPGWCVPSK